MKKLVLSTGNKNKLREIKSILKDLDIEIVTKDDIGQEDFDVVEDRDSLEGNAIKKALELKKHTDALVMADDTGLFVDYLDGAPGIHSARYAGLDHDFKANNEKLLRELEGVEEDQRGAYFETVIALALENGEIETISARCHGKIGFEERGQGGFGYDPLFIVDGYGKSFAELGDQVKNKISHRSQALEKLKNHLVELLED